MTSENKRTGLEVAVIGMSGRFPGAPDLKSFWQLLAAGEEGISNFSDTENTSNTDEGFIRAKGRIDDRLSFDYEFFGYTKAEAEVMDPQMRLFHEYVWLALEDAAIDPFSYSGNISLFEGSNSSFDWRSLLASQQDKSLLDIYTDSMLSESDLIATRVAHKLNLKGPALSLYTACSTSLVAVHLATRSLLLGESNIAVAGAVSVSLLNDDGYPYNQGMIMSADGHCRPFDSQSSGTVFGDGVGVVVLKKLDRALADGDTIHAVIKGSAINNDGNRKAGYTAPSLTGQRDVIANAHKIAQVDPATIGYVEAHGTGTHLGDPVEIKALDEAFNGSLKRAFPIGSVKSNIGHVDTVAGIAGMIKTILALKHQQIPPSINFDQANEEIDFEGKNFYVQQQLSTWEKGQTPRRAGVSSFGIGGTNAHMVLEEAPMATAMGTQEENALLTLSAKDEAALLAYAESLAEHLQENKPLHLPSVAYSLSRKHAFSSRFSLVANTAEEATLKLQKLSKSDIQEVNAAQASLAFMFSGQGSQHAQMAKDLYESDTVFKDQVDECLKILSGLSTYDYRWLLMDNQATDLNETQHTQPLLFAIEYALAKSMMAKGYGPDVVMGHSLGEYVAACISGLFSLKDALFLIFHRGRLMQSMPKGDMLSVFSTEESIKPLLNGSLDIAAINAPDSIVVSGASEKVAALRQKLEEQEIRSTMLNTSHAFHSELMSPVAKEFEQYLAMVTFRTLEVPLVSNLTGQRVTTETISKPDYWTDQLRSTVLFHKGIETLSGDPSLVFVEVGPGRVLTDLVSVSETPQAVNLLPHTTFDGNRNTYFTRQLGKIWELGYVPDWDAYYTNQAAQKITLPTYKFRKHPFELPKVGNHAHYLNPNQAATTGTRETGYYSMEWKRLAASKGGEKPILPSDNWLVFGVEGALSQFLVKRIQEVGAQVTEVVEGKAFSKVGASRYEASATPESMESLLEALRSDDPYNKILFLWPFGKDSVPAKGMSTFIGGSILPLFHLVRYGQDLFTDKTKLTVAAAGAFQVLGHEYGHPIGSLLAGLVQVINKEFGNLSARFVDLDPSFLWKDSLSDAELRDLFFHSPGEAIVARRGQYLWTESPAPLDQLPTQSFTPDPAKTYLITGGVGGIGLLLAEEMTVRGARQLVLVSRRTLDQIVDENSETAAALERIKGQGCTLAVVQADISNEEEVKKAIDRVKEQFGAIHGVFHSAGVADGALLINRDLDSIIQVMLPKVHGTLLLERFLEKEPLDFMILFSSLNSILGEVGQTAYSISNHFLDRFAAYASSTKKHPVISINWDRWKDTGMAATTNLENLDYGISSEEAISVLFNLMESGLYRVAVSSLPLEERMKREVNLPIDSHLDELGEEDSDREELPTNEGNIQQIFNEILGSEVAPEDNFFEVGGTSLSAIRLLANVHRTLGHKVPLEVFFSYPSVTQLFAYLDSKKSDAFRSLKEFDGQGTNKIASSIQKRLYLLQQGALTATYYNMPQVLIWEQADFDALSTAFRQLFATHPILRAIFKMEGGTLNLTIGETDPEPLEHIHISPDESLREVFQSFIRPFDVVNGPLARAAYVTDGTSRHYLFFDIHHIITDAISLNLIFQDFVRMYVGQEPVRQDSSYLNYLDWLESREYTKSIADQKAHWQTQFEGDLPVLELPYDRARPAKKDNQGKLIRSAISKESYQGLDQLMKEQGISLFSLLVGAYQLMLCKASRQQEVVIGTSVTGRHHADSENIVGLFASTLPLRFKLDQEAGLMEQLIRIHETCNQSFSNQLYPYEQLLDDLSLEWDQSRNPLFDVMFDLKKPTKSLQVDGQEIRVGDLGELGIPYNTSKFDLTLTATDTGEYVFFDWEYATSLFDEATIGRFAHWFEEIIDTLLADPSTKVVELMGVNAEEQAALTTGVNPAPVTTTSWQSFLDRFEHQVAQTPDATAISQGDNQLSYEKLNYQANQLAYNLTSGYEVKSGDTIAVLLNRSEYSIISMLAILKCQASFLPIDPSYPQKRIAYILEDAAVNVLITERAFLFDLDFFNGSLLGIDLQLASMEGPTENTEHQLDPTAVAYMIYTSGTTGDPKGVEVSHGAFANYLSWVEEHHLNTGQVCFPLFTSLGFDLTITSIFTPLSFGGKVHILEGNTPDKLITSLIKDDQVTAIKLTPSHLAMLLELEALHGHSMHNLKCIIVGGEILTREVAGRAYELFGGNVAIINEYGPTETTVGCTAHVFDPAKDHGTSVPVGTAGRNMQVYLLDERKQLVPYGTKGEVFVGGDGVALGYKNKPDETLDCFMDHLFLPDQKMYRTGDFGRWNNDGQLIILGRKDDQVKLRGYRIELKEVENALLSLEIKDAVVTTRKMGNEPVLVAYYVANQGTKKSDIQKGLAAQLPPYMIPDQLIMVDEIPLTTNQKPDIKALLKLNLSDTEESHAPVTELEVLLAKFYTEELDLEKVSLNDNFFALGGQSLKAVALSARVHDTLGLNVEVKDIFDNPSVGSLARFIEQMDTTIEIANIPKAPTKEYYAISSAQRKMYLAQEKLPDNTMYNAPRIIEFDHFDMDKMEVAFQQLIQRHEILRTSFHIQTVPVQRVHDQVSFSINRYVATTQEEVGQILSKFVQPFKLSEAPLLRVVFIEYNEVMFLLMDTHHIASDAISTQIVIKDVMAYYAAQEPHEVAVQYKDFAEWQKAQLAEDLDLENQRAFWMQQLESPLPKIALPYDHKLEGYEGKRVLFHFPKETTDRIVKYTRERNYTEFVLLIGAFGLFVHQLTGEEDVTTGFPVTGREFSALKDTVGAFFNTLVLRSYPKKDKTIHQYLDEVKHTMLDALKNQDYPLEEITTDLKLKVDTLVDNALYQVMFSYKEDEELFESLGEYGLSARESDFARPPIMAKAPLAFLANRLSDQIAVVAEYRITLFEEETINRYIEYYKQLIELVLSNDSVLISEINLTHDVHEVDNQHPDVDFDF